MARNWRVHGQGPQGSIPGWGTKILKTKQHSQINKYINITKKERKRIKTRCKTHLTAALIVHCNPLLHLTSLDSQPDSQSLVQHDLASLGSCDATYHMELSPLSEAVPRDYS